MKTKELQTKSAEELGKLLADTQREVSELLTKARQQDLKNVRALRAARKQVARLKTFLAAKITG